MPIIQTNIENVKCYFAFSQFPSSRRGFRRFRHFEKREVLRQWRVEYEHLQELNGDRWAGTPYVFVRDDGSRMHPDSITAWLNRFSAQNDLPHIHPHAFRHTAASMMIANGVDLVTTAAELGHANANTTATIYAHQIAIARATAADVRAGVFAGRK